MLQLFKNISNKATKPLLFGFCGAVGCLISSLAGEAFLNATYRPPEVPTTVTQAPQSVVLVIDSSGSMEKDGKIGEVKKTATSFVERQNLNDNEMGKT